MTLRFTSTVLLAAMLGCSAQTAGPVVSTDASTGGTDASKPDTSAVEDTATSCAPSEIKCDGVCVDVTSDPANCGSCKKSCASGQACVGGSCMCASPKVTCGSACIDTQTDTNNCGTCGNICETGKECSEGKCAPPCPTGQTRCGGVCVDTKSDAKHCGMCGKACATSEGCTDGVCGIACDYPTKNCGGTCVNVNFDANNCGACGKKCPTGSKGTANCTSGSCILTCETGYGNCDDDATNGCEKTLSSDDKNCGLCGKACLSTETCISSKCECKTGTAKCGTSCVDLTSNAAYCGSCTNACATNEMCSSALCVCKTGFTKCGTTCVDTKTDATNCGACGTSCAFGSTCSDGKCCPTGQINCGGTCIDPTKDPLNCSACGAACSTPTKYCVASACASSCGSGTVDCSGTCTVTATDPKNCGACGTVCPTGQVCYGGACTISGFPGSNIINATDATKINAWVGTPGQLWTRCYSKTLNGASATTFHSLCNNKGATVTVASLSTGKVIGGYAPAAFISTTSTTSAYRGDNTAFLFSLTNDFKHTPRMTSSFVYDYYTYGPTWGNGHDWHVASAINSGYCYIGYTYNCRIGSNGGTDTTCRNDFCGTYDTWSINDLEVWSK